MSSATERVRVIDADDLVLPKANDRVAFVGPTSSGKTTFARELMRLYDNGLVIAPKGEWDWKLRPPADPRRAEQYLARYRRRTHTPPELARELREVAAARSGDPVVYLPHPTTPDQFMAELDAAYALALARGNTLVYTDELYFHSSGGDFMKRSPKLFFAYTTGRTRGVGAWSAFQRPAWVPLVAVTESEQLYVWGLRSKADRDRIEDRAGKGAIDWDTLLDVPHSFVVVTDRGVSEPLILDLPGAA